MSEVHSVTSQLPEEEDLTEQPIGTRFGSQLRFESFHSVTRSEHLSVWLRKSTWDARATDCYVR